MLRRLFGHPKCPISEPEKTLVEDQFALLVTLFGAERIRTVTVVEPNDRFFPYSYDGSPESATRLFHTVATHMQIDAASLELEFWDDAPAHLGLHAPGVLGGFHNKTAAGFYASTNGVQTIVINTGELRYPDSVVATAAHELAHVLLLGGGLISRDEPHMEAFTDLATIVLGFGVFTANNLLRRRTWTDGNSEGWSIQRKGYISVEMAGWALSLFAEFRGERNPGWAKYLNSEPKQYFREGVSYLRSSKVLAPEAKM